MEALCTAAPGQAGSGAALGAPAPRPPPPSLPRAAQGLCPALPQQLCAAPCCPPSCQPRERPGLGGCRARKALAMHIDAVCAVFALADGAKCRVRPCHKVAIFTKDMKLYASLISQPGFMPRARVHPCSSLLLFSAFGPTRSVGIGLRQIRPGAGFLLLGF